MYAHSKSGIAYRVNADGQGLRIDVVSYPRKGFETVPDVSYVSLLRPAKLAERHFDWVWLQPTACALWPCSFVSVQNIS
jgi:hypothetical protein